jgi:hypothetical protein
VWGGGSDKELANNMKGLRVTDYFLVFFYQYYFLLNFF